MKRLLFFFIIGLVLFQSPARADFSFMPCLESLGDLRLIGVSYPDDDGTIYYGFDIVGGGWVGVYLYANGDAHVQTYDNRDFWCFPGRAVHEVQVITKYPLGGAAFTWAVQDDFGHWFTVQDQGAVVVTPLEYDDLGRPMTRLVVRHSEPADPTRYAIFNEDGVIVG